MYEIEKCRKPVDLVKLTGQRCRQVKPETVDMHLGDPVPERIHDQLQRVKVLDHGRMRKTGIRAAQLFLHIWMTASHSLHVRFIDDRFVQWGFGGPVIAPLEIRVVHHRSENVRSAVGGVDGALVAELVRVAGWVPPDLSFYCAGVWIQQKLAW